MAPQQINIRIIVEGPEQLEIALRAAEDNGFEEVKGTGLKPSQRMRLALGRQYAAMHGGAKMPELWYEQQIDRIISVIDKKR